MIKKLALLCLSILLSGCGGDPEVDRSRHLGTMSAQSAAQKITTAPGERRAYAITWSSGKLKGVSQTSALNTFELPVSEIRLPDISLTFDNDGPAGQLYRLYRASFGRTPDVKGFGYWKDALEGRGLSLEQVAVDFLSSAESKAIYGAESSDALFIGRLYQNVLNRKPDSAGENYWNNLLKSGAKRSDVLMAFADSSENKSATASVTSAGMPFAEPNIAYIPVANSTGPTDVSVGSIFEVNGSTSTDANDDAIAYSWTITSKPVSSTAAFTISNVVTPKIALDKPGTYELSLWVKDAVSQGYSAAKLTVIAHATIADTGTYTCSSVDSNKAQSLFSSGHVYLDRNKDGLACNAADVAYERSPTIPAITDAGIYKCSTLSRETAFLLYLQGHTYLDRDRDGKPCEANDITVEKAIYTPAPVVSPPSTGMCWVNGYRRSNGTYVSGYYRRC